MSFIKQSNTMARDVVKDLKLYRQTVQLISKQNIRKISPLETLESDEIKFIVCGKLNIDTELKLRELGWRIHQQQGEGN
jgi:hypothetical protein